MNSWARASAALIASLSAVAVLVACSPSLNWRDVRDTDARFTVLLPAKPASHARDVNLNGLTVKMQMTAAEVDDMNFAVASAVIDDEQQRTSALANLQQAMVNNIGGRVLRQKTLTLKDGTEAVEIEATGAMANGRRMALFARFATKAPRVYQAVAIGPADSLTAEVAEPFLSSFTLQ